MKNSNFCTFALNGFLYTYKLYFSKLHFEEFLDFWLNKIQLAFKLWSILQICVSEMAQRIFSKNTFLKSVDQAEKNEL